MHFYHRLRGNARGSSGSRRTLTLNMYMIDVEFKNVHSPLTVLISRRGRPRSCRWPQHDTCSKMWHRCGHTDGEREPVSPDRLKRCAS